MTKAFVETTILVDALLKEGEKKKAATKALGMFSETLLPVYAIKEFKAGALTYFVWVHNKLVETKSYDDTLAAIQKIAMSPKKYLPATAVEALAVIGKDYKKLPLGQLAEKYGEAATLDAMLCDHARLSVKRRIAKAWRQRRQLTHRVVFELPCYAEPEPSFEGSGQLDLAPTACEKGKQCCIAKAHNESADVATLERAVPTGTGRREDSKRKAALKLIRLGRPFSHGDCRALGDAVFALQCPDDAAILTTNSRDHRPLAEALGKKVLTPSEATSSSE